MTAYQISRQWFSRRLLAAWIGLALLFAAMAPASSAPLGFAARCGFWLLHVGVGLIAATLAARWLLTYTSLRRDWRLIAVSGLTGVIVFAPVAFVLEFAFPGTGGDIADGALDRWGEQSVLQSIVVEAIELSPSYLAAWFLINLESISALLKPATAASGALADEATAEPISGESSPRSMLELPAAIGGDIVAITSDLHYLHVHTTLGKAMILGALNDAEIALEGKGSRVHRSHWIAYRHARKWIRAGSGWMLEMSNDLRIPVSRRRRSTVVEKLGKDFEVSAFNDKEPVGENE